MTDHFPDAGKMVPEALLRQALDALERGETTLRFAAIAALKQRMGEKT